jgi:hypothetical protein
MSKIITPSRLASLGFLLTAGLATMSHVTSADAAVGNRFCETHSLGRAMKCCTAHMRSNSDYRGNITGLSCNRSVIVCKKVSIETSTYAGGASTTVCYVSQQGKFKKFRHLSGGENHQPPSTQSSANNTPGNGRP